MSDGDIIAPRRPATRLPQLTAPTSAPSTSPTSMPRRLVGAADNAGQTAAVLDEFDALVAEVLDRLPRARSRCSVSRLVAHEEKAALLDRVLGGRVSPHVAQFSQGRLPPRAAGLPAGDPPPGPRAVRQDARPGAGAVGHRRRRWTTALADAIAAGLAPLVGGEPVLEPVVDPELIGGIVVRVGDTVYDGSSPANCNHCGSR